MIVKSQHAVIRGFESTSAVCLTDKQRLFRKIQEGTLFGQETDPDVCSQLWMGFCSTKHLIPSFRTLFQDLSYLKRCQNSILAGLAIRAQPTTAGSLFKLFINNPACTNECAELRKMYSSCESRACEHFPGAYLRLWLFVMRHNHESNVYSAQPGYQAGSHANVDDSSIHKESGFHLARYANELGFDSYEIRGMMDFSMDL